MFRICKPILVFLFCFIIGIGTFSLETLSTTSADIEQLTINFTEAVVKRNQADLEMILADKIETDFPLEKATVTRDYLVSKICEYEFIVKSIEISNVSVKYNDNIAEITFKQVEQVESPKQFDPSLIERKSECKFKFEKQENKWRLSSIKINRTI